MLKIECLRGIVGISILALTLFGCSIPASAQTVGPGAITDAASARKAVVRIEALGAFVPLGEQESVLESSTGTGFIIDPAGIVVTNAHVVNGGEVFEVYLDGEKTPRYATVLGVSECSDLAVLDIRGGGYPYLYWATSAPRIGQRVQAIGYPGGTFKKSSGSIEDIYGEGDTPWTAVDNVIYHTAAIAPGNSGGPLINQNGRVLGVNFAGYSDDDWSTGIAAAISWEEAEPIVEVLASGTDLDSVGINGEAFFVPAETTDENDLYGIWVVSVESGSPAAYLGIQPADILLNLEKIPVGTDGNMGSYCGVIRSHSEDEIMRLVLIRYSTRELLCGEFNGEPLFNCDSLIEQEDSSPTSGTIGGQNVVGGGGNGIYSPISGATIWGITAVSGVAVHPDFQKWQVDLLVNGSKEVYLGSGGMQSPSPENLLVFDTAPYPNGQHILRLRVVRNDGNYDEYFSQIYIQN